MSLKATRICSKRMGDTLDTQHTAVVSWSAEITYEILTYVLIFHFSSLADVFFVHFLFAYCVFTTRAPIVPHGVSEKISWYGMCSLLLILGVPYPTQCYATHSQTFALGIYSPAHSSLSQLILLGPRPGKQLRNGGVRARACRCHIKRAVDQGRTTNNFGGGRLHVSHLELLRFVGCSAFWASQLTRQKTLTPRNTHLASARQEEYHTLFRNGGFGRGTVQRWRNSAKHPYTMS